MVGVGVALLFVPGVGTAVGVALIAGGISVAIGTFISSRMQPDSQKQVEGNASFVFKGPTNSTKQGVAIPRGYGRCLVGSNVVSVAVYSEDYDG